MKVMSYYTEQKDFDYEAPDMFYDKKSGEIKIQEKQKEEGSAKKIIKNTNDLDLERKRLFAEEGLNEEGKLDDVNLPVDKYAASIKKV